MLWEDDVPGVSNEDAVDAAERERDCAASVDDVNELERGVDLPSPAVDGFRLPPRSFGAADSPDRTESDDMASRASLAS